MHLRTLIFIAASFFISCVEARTFGEPYLLCELSDNQINESSGLCPSRYEEGIYFTHNDSGDTARFFKFDLLGQVLSSHTLVGATAVDWEDMASALLEEVSYIYLGDIGDNGRIRESIRVYRCIEPPTDLDQITEFDTYDLIYPDGAHDAEAVMAHPFTGDIYIASKDFSGLTNIYKLPAPSTSGTYELEFIGSIQLGPFMAVTGGAISPDGQFVILRTYFGAFEFPAPKNFDEWPSSPRLSVTLATEQQGEAITYSPDGWNLLTSAEVVPCPISAVPLLEY